MQAILTRYLNPGNVLGPRIKATCVSGSVTIDYPHESMEPHEVACRALQTKLADKKGAHWLAPMVGGELPSGDWAWVFVR